MPAHKSAQRHASDLVIGKLRHNGRRRTRRALLSQSTQPHDHARGADEARKLQAGSGTYLTESPKPEALDKEEIARDARAARRLLLPKA